MSTVPLNAREIFNLSTEEVWNLPDGPMQLEFEDGVVDTTARETIFSHYCAEFIRQYPKTPCLKRHHVAGTRMGKGTHLRLLGNCLWDCFDAYDKQLDMEELCRTAYEVTNRIYNDFTYKLKAYVTSLSVLDFLDVVHHPKIWEANRTVKPNQLSIEHTYTAIRKVLLDENELVGNQVAKTAKSGLVSMGQTLQCVGPRGYLTEIDGTFFKHPILTGFMEGIRTLHDSMIESRSAAKALLYAKDPVAESEYFNRKLQLGTSTLANLHLTDCGTSDAIPMDVRASDLEAIQGKYYYTKEGLKRISIGDRHLIGTRINMRSVLKCRHPDPYGFCAVCFGELAYSVPRGTNIGHVSTTVLCEAISQNILSTKHLDTSATSGSLRISDYDLKYIREGSIENTIRLADRLEGHTVHMVLNATECPLLANVNYIDDVRKLSVERVTELSEVKLIIDKGTEHELSTVVSVSKGSMKSSLTYEALKYIGEHGWTLVESQDYQIDLRYWDLEQPLFSLPMKHASMVDYMKSIESYFKSTKSGRRSNTKVKSSLKDFETAEKALLGFYELVSEKLSVNIAHLETIVASAMVRDEKEFDHRLPKPFADGQVGPYTDNMFMRSGGSTMAFEKHVQFLYDVRSFMVKTRPDNPMDEVLCPRPGGTK